jgi:hypothetical protein
MKNRASALGLLFVCVLFVSLFIPVGSTHAWTFSFDFSQGQNQFGYVQYGQIGRNGFFGLYDVDNSSTPGAYANLNSWLGNTEQAVGQLASGSNASISQYSITVDPGIGNEWIKLRGRYNINLYETGSSQGAFTVMSPSLLAMWSLDVDLPMFKIGYGKKQFKHGMGLQFGYNRTKEYLAIEHDFLVPDILASLVCKGALPRRVLSYFNPEGWGRYASELAKGDEIPEPSDPSWPKTCGSFAGGAIGCAYLKVGYGVMPWQFIGTAYVESPFVFGVSPFNPNDVSAGVPANWLAYLLYESTDLIVGVGITRTALHAGPELVPPNASGIDPLNNLLNSRIWIREHTPTQEVYLSEGWAFFSYNNGRFLCNAELDWYNRILRLQRTVDGRAWDSSTNTLLPEFDPITGASIFRPRYFEGWRFLAEAGVIRGPTIVKGMFAWLPGPDRRHGILIDRQPFVQFVEQQAISVFDPYCILLNAIFGSGVDAPHHINAATALGGKIDHSLAANLIVSASFLKAWRNSHGYGLGFVRPSVVEHVPPAPPDPGSFGTVNYSIRGTFPLSSPSIPENDLGWEGTLGLTWQLADKFFLDGRFTYWQPGRWFNYACIDRSVPAWNEPSPLNNWGVNPDRNIDPVYGIELRLSASY